MASITLSDVITASKHSIDELLNVFLVGSRAWGTAGPDSDWDLFVILKGEARTDAVEMTDDGRINLTLFSEAVWRRWLVKEHNLQAIACLYLPESHILLNAYDWAQEFRLDQKRLKFSALRKASSSFNRARVYWIGLQDIFDPKDVPRIVLTKEDQEALSGLTRAEAEKKSKKMIAHCFRTCYFALQLFATGMITDLKCVVPIWEELVADKATEWSYYVDKYEARYHALIDNFPEVCEELADEELLKIPERLHRLVKLVNLPKIQSGYMKGVEREMILLVRQEAAVQLDKHLNPDPEDYIDTASLITQHLPEWLPLFQQTQALYDRMVDLMAVDHKNLMAQVSKRASDNNTKVGQELAVYKGLPHYTVLFGMWKQAQDAKRYLVECPLTHFDFAEHYARTSPQYWDYAIIPDIPLHKQR